MSPALLAIFFAAALATAAAGDNTEPPQCEAAAEIDSGRLCGLRRVTAGGKPYASFLGVPYAKQPLEELRFKELQPLEPWEGVLNATRPGPVCPQTDVFYGKLKMARGGMREDCIHANVHAPLRAQRPGPFPVLVFVHGGGFAFGSGDTDLYGPGYLMEKDVVVVTFNYRLNLLGFLSLNTSSVPGNNGIRDAVTLLRWVRRNARAFGGDPDNVTVGGQSAGAVIAHLLTLSSAAEGLFQRAICMSGVATSDFFSSSPQYAQAAAHAALGLLGIDATLGPERVHKQLLVAPLPQLMKVNEALLDAFGLTTFVPVVESPHPGVTPMLEADPEVLMRRGRGRHTPLLIGFTDAECESFVPRFDELEIEAKLNSTPALLVTPRLTHMVPQEALARLAGAAARRYRRAAGGFVRFCSDAYYVYPALRVARQRVEAGQPTRLYRFSYGGQRSVIKEAFELSFQGAGHVEDLTYAFEAEAVRAGEASLAPEDKSVVRIMTNIFATFMNGSTQLDGSAWPALCSRVQYAAVDGARPQVTDVLKRDQDVLDFFDGLYDEALRA